MTEKIIRNYLEIKSIDKLLIIKKPNENYSLECVSPNDFQLNKFFYKQIGKNYHWIDRLVWPDKSWIEYISNTNFRVYFGPFNNIKSLKNAFDDITPLNFENIEIIKL